jgi:hypothetical protein
MFRNRGKKTPAPAPAPPPAPEPSPVPFAETPKEVPLTPLATPKPYVETPKTPNEGNDGAASSDSQQVRARGREMELVWRHRFEDQPHLPSFRWRLGRAVERRSRG